MKLKILLISLALCSALSGHSQTSMTAGAGRLLNYIEQHIIEVAEAMPENRFDFTPDSLHISGSEFKAVRSFAGQIKHLATDNFFIWSAITGDNMPAGAEDVNGPASLKTKSAIIAYLKQSFAVGHKAISTLTTANAMDMIDFRGGKLPRVDLAFYALTHANEHYGQLVIYLRMCGIIPPASRPDRPQ
jgi:DinB superfamily